MTAVDAPLVPPQRLIDLGAVHNFRDLGGYVADDGREVRWRRLFRADGLDRLTAADLDLLRPFGLRTVIDLRSAGEIDQRGRFPFEQYPVTFHHLAVIDTTRNTDDAEARQRFLEVIHRHSTRMERLVTDLLRLARLDAGQESVELVRCDARTLIGNVVSDFEATAHEKRQQLNATITPAAASIVIDPAKFHDVIRNLVENAVNYTPEGGRVDILADLHDHRYRIIVQDDGPGIPPEDLSRVFERFYRVDKSRARPGGTGLGLAIVRNLVNVLSGEIAVANRAGGGAMFTVLLPLLEEPSEHRPPELQARL